jgi:DNA repair protein RadC
MTGTPGVADRPREKLDRLGPAALGDNELVAIVLGQGGGGRSALGLANEVLSIVGGLHRLARAPGDELRRIDGVGPARAAQIQAAVELGRRSLAPGLPLEPLLRSPQAVAEHLAPRFGLRAVEQFGVVLLDRRHRHLKTTLLTVGTADASQAHPRDVYRAAVVAGASGVIVFHNHPSGDPTPSPDDERITRQLALAGEIVGIDFIDHLILCATGYYSFKERRQASLETGDRSPATGPPSRRPPRR